MGVKNFFTTGVKSGFTGRTGVIKKEADRLKVGPRLGQMKTVGNVAMGIAQTAVDMGVGGSAAQSVVDVGTKVEDYGKTAAQMAGKAERLEATTRSAASGDTGAITQLAIGGMQGAQKLQNRRK